MKDSTIRAAYIGGIFVLVAAIVGAYIAKYGLPFTSGEVTIAGMVIDQQTNSGVSQASINNVGRSEQYLTEDNGNFRFTLSLNKGATIRLHVTKPGYKTLDQTVGLPAEDLTLPLQKQ
jgi:hypothetical protein